MATAAAVTTIVQAANAGKRERFNTKDRIADAMTPEIVIALCGPLGTPLHRVSQTLKDLLKRTYDYKHVDEIRLSKFIREHG